MSELTPAAFCHELMATLAASEGRRRRRRRDTTPDAIGLAMKRTLLEQAIADAPEADQFEEWLYERVLDSGDGNGGVRAVAISVLEEWRLAQQVGDFRVWLAAGAPSDDAPRADTHT